jgi:beta-barrel assembly-enhancing protease
MFRGFLSAVLALCLATPAMAQTASGPSASDSPQQQTTANPQPQPAPDAQSASSVEPQSAPSAEPAPAATDSQSASPAEPQAAPADQSTPPPEKQPDREKHDGGKNDVEAIGNRNVGQGSGLGNWYSIEKEVQMGKQYAQQVEASSKLISDPVVNEYVNRVGQNLVRNSDARVPFTIKVIDSDEINAFALPGGFFFVNSGLILAADEEAELAGVMAHEIAHVCARHATRQMTRAQWANIGSIPLIFVGGGIGYAARSAAGLMMPATFMSFSRGFEAEADYLGLQYMYKTGYDPQAFISFFEKIEAKEKKKPGAVAKVFASHPQTPDRIAKSQDEIEHVLPPRDQYVVNTSEFDDVKARLARIENKRKINNEKKEGAPTLRRASTDHKEGNGGGSDSTQGQDQTADDRPTLKRRGDDD